MLFEECPQVTPRIMSRGDEFVGHGRTNAERQDAFSEDDERRLIAGATETIKKHTGKQPRGWMGPYFAQTPVTLDLLKEAGYSYVLDWPADDQPFWLKTRSGPTTGRPDCRNRARHSSGSFAAP